MCDTNKWPEHALQEVGEPLLERCDAGHRYWYGSKSQERGCPVCLRAGLIMARNAAAEHLMAANHAMNELRSLQARFGVSTEN